MIGFKNLLHKNFFFILIPFFFISCGSFGFNKTAGNMENNNTNQSKMFELEAELSSIKQEQMHLKTQMGNKDKEIQNLQNKVLALEKKISNLKKNKSSIKKTADESDYKKPAVLYKKARNLLIEEDYTNSAVLFNQFIKNYPRHSLADNAQYWLAECHYSMGKYQKAILVFKDIQIKFPKSEKVPDAILKLGYSYLALDDLNRAHHYFKKVIKKYPFSPAAEIAQEKLRSFE